jgi:hypothetical protein
MRQRRVRKDAKLVFPRNKQLRSGEGTRVSQLPPVNLSVPILPFPPRSPAESRGSVERAPMAMNELAVPLRRPWQLFGQLSAPGEAQRSLTPAQLLVHCPSPGAVASHRALNGREAERTRTLRKEARAGVCGWQRSRVPVQRCRHQQGGTQASESGRKCAKVLPRGV